jgi:hypothetical protein
MTEEVSMFSKKKDPEREAMIADGWHMGQFGEALTAGTIWVVMFIIFPRRTIQLWKENKGASNAPAAK